MESIILGIIVIGGGAVAVFSPSMIKFFSHRPANGELKTLSRLSERVEKLSNHHAVHHHVISPRS